MNPAQRLLLDVRIDEERMTEIEPHGAEPNWLWQFTSRQPIVWTMRDDGTVSPSWIRLDEVAWVDVVAIRMTWDHGQPIEIAELGEDEGDFYGFGPTPAAIPVDEAGDPA